MNPINKDPVQKHIEYLTLTIWLGLCIATYFMFEDKFAIGVFIGGIICIINYFWLYRHTKNAITLAAQQGKSFMARRYILRLATIAVTLYLLIVVLQVNVIGLLIGLSVVILGIMSYACFTYIFAGGD